MPLGSNPNSSRLAGIRVLIVDDLFEARRLLAKVLVVHGAEVFEAVDAAMAVDQLGSFKPDVLLCDLAMPQEDAFAFIRKLRTLPGYRTLPAIAVTSYENNVYDQEVRDAGFDGRIDKTDLMQILPDAILQVLAARRR